tara:strand:+ start:281 stop:724 length:444 start_codon:yes stop_codon:yes gene_type:complete
MTNFEKRFFKVLKENDDEKEAFELELDDDTSSEDFDVDVEADVDAIDGMQDPAAMAAKATAEVHSQQVNTLKGWISSGDQFLKLLNDAEDPNSVQAVLANAQADTIFDRMKQSEQRKIARVATELASLNESFRGYLAQTDNAQFRGV